MQKKIKVVATLLIIICGCSHQNMSAESWIDYNDLSKISAGFLQKELIAILGEPLLFLGNNEDGKNTVFLYYLISDNI